VAAVDLRERGEVRLWGRVASCGCNKEAGDGARRKSEEVLRDGRDGEEILLGLGEGRVLL
jgi:hypothetical protein